MSTYERVKYFTDKKNGLGVTMGTLAKASGYSLTSLSVYLASPPNERSVKQENAWEMGMQKIAKDMYKFVFNEE